MTVERRAGEKDEEYFVRLRLELGGVKPNSLGITRERVEKVLRRLDKTDRNIVSVVVALLDDTLPNAYRDHPSGSKFKDGASTSQIFCHAGILQNGEKKIDREGRDYLIKPLVAIGAIEPIFLDSEKRQFLAGHPKAKSPNIGYRLSQSFIDVLKQPSSNLESSFSEWISEDKKRERLKMQHEAAEKSLEIVFNRHAELIKAVSTFYVPYFLKGFEIVYSDFEDGDRISEHHKSLLTKAGIGLTLDDPYPDLLLWNPLTDEFWVVEAVISDGEVDSHKIEGTIKMLNRYGKKVSGFTTAYQSWKNAASRQSSEKNIAPNTYLWILEDSSKQWFATSA